MQAMAESTWTERERLILEAVREAEEAGENMASAASKAVPDLPFPLYARTIESLVEAGYLGAIVKRRGDGEPYLALVQRLLPEGRRAVGQWPGSDPAVELERVLTDVLDRESDPDRRTRIERLKTAVSDSGKDVITGVLTELAKRVTLGG